MFRFLVLALFWMGLTSAQALIHPGSMADRVLTVHQGKLQSADSARLRQARLVVFYYSADWCGPCRQFTPKLVRFYNAAKPRYPHFEIVMLSQDRNDAGLLMHLVRDQIPWPTVRADQIPPRLLTGAVHGIPTLIVVNGEGRVLTQSWQEGRQRAPEVIMGEINLLLQKQSPR